MSSKMGVNTKLLPIKGHYFFFNAGTAPLVPYLSTYARQLGFSSKTVGLIYTVLPIFGLIAKPLFGVIADRFKIQKSLFIIFQVVTIVSFLGIYFVPGSQEPAAVELDCGGGLTVLRSCYDDPALVDQCKVDTLAGTNTTARCKMNCDMSSPKMWQTVCLHWHIPQYCYSHPSTLQYSASLAALPPVVDQQCLYFTAANVTLDGYSYTPRCRVGQGYVDVDTPCLLTCSRQEALTSANMTCRDHELHYRVCSPSALHDFTDTQWAGDLCQVSCELDGSSPWKLMEICEGWGAATAASCRPAPGAAPAPHNLSFVADLPLDTTIREHGCVFTRIKHIELPDGSIHVPTCNSREQYQLETELFQTSCQITCDNEMLMEVLEGGMAAPSSSPYTRQFWLFFLLMAVSWIGQAVVVTFADAICFNLLGSSVALYGKQRLWGSVGWGVFSLATGSLIDALSDGAYKDYTVAFALMLVFMTGDVIVSAFLKTESTKMSVNIVAEVGTLVSSLPTFVFLCWTVAAGLCTGLIWSFLFWLVEDVAREQMTCGEQDYTKTLQGLVSAIQTFGGEIPFLFVSGYILRVVGHVNTMSLVLFAFGVRFMLYSVLTNVWWVLPIEMLQGVTFGMFYPTMTSYATIVSPAGTETTVQGVVGAVFEGVGTALGSLVGGVLYEAVGGPLTFRWFGGGAFLCCALHALAQHLLRHKTAHISQGYSAVIRYEQPNDMVYMLQDH